MESIMKSSSPLRYLGLYNPNIQYQLTQHQLVDCALERNEGSLADSGALAVDTGKFTGRSPKDRFIVDDHISHDQVWWGNINYKLDGGRFMALCRKMQAYLNKLDVLFVRDCRVCADEQYHMDVRVITETAYQNLFAHHLFIRPEKADISQRPGWTVVAAPGFEADPETDGTRQKNFTIISFSKKVILIGGTGYTGEIKKSIFSVLNFILPHDHGVLPMHCSANVGEKGDTAIFFGLSGTGKTTLSADAGRKLIGDDEHGWSDNGIFNFEGGCYAKCAGLSIDKEPQIYHAIKPGALLENINYIAGTTRVDFDNIAKTENTRVAYPVENIANALMPSVAGVPQNIFFLTADAFGVLPPIAKLTAEQAMYHFVSGYTAKVAGTENGINEPKLTFSACFGEAFLPLNPIVYAEMLGEKIRKYHVNVWLVNTGWTGGPYGVGQRMRLSYTRAMVTAALNGGLDHVGYRPHPVFNVMMPESCPGVPDSVLDPQATWASASQYEEQAHQLAAAFIKNFDKYAAYGTEKLTNAGPRAVETV